MKDPRELLLEASGGDRESVEALLERYLPRAHAIVRQRMGRLLRAREESVDIVQSVCRQVLENRDAYEHRSDEHFRRWLVEVVEHKIVDHYRRQSAQRRDVGREERPTPGNSLEGVRQNASGPGTVAGHREEVERLQEAMQALPEEELQALQLFHFEGLSYESIAERMGLTFKQARRRVQKAKLTLGQQLKTPDA